MSDENEEGGCEYEQYNLVGRNVDTTRCVVFQQ